MNYSRLTYPRNRLIAVIIYQQLELDNTIKTHEQLKTFIIINFYSHVVISQLEIKKKCVGELSDTNDSDEMKDDEDS